MVSILLVPVEYDFSLYEDRIEIDLSVCGPGEHFGEVALLSASSYR